MGGRGLRSCLEVAIMGIGMGLLVWVRTLDLALFGLRMVTDDWS
jgi:hypothetical protein